MPYRRTSPQHPLALLAAGALASAAFAGPAVAATTAPAPTDRFVSTQLPDSAIGGQARWLIDASTRRLGDAELRRHASRRFLRRAGPGEQRRRLLRAVRGARGLRLVGVDVAEPAALVAEVRDRAGRDLVLTMFADRAGSIDNAVLAPAPSLPRPTGAAAVGSDRVELVDHRRGDRVLMVTRYYPASAQAVDLPLDRYAGPLLAAAIAPLYADDPEARAAALATPAVRAHAHYGAAARPGRLPVVLFSPGGGAPRVLYRALAEDLASHGYLVVAVDHTGEAPVELADGTILPISPRWDSGARLADLRFALRSLDAMGPGPRADLRRVAAIGHSLGGSTAAALMRAEPSIRAGVDMDGLIEGAASRRGVPRAFMVMAAGPAVLARRDVRGLLAHSTGPRLALQFSGFDHFSFSDAPVIAPLASGVGRHPSARDIAVQRAYLRAFLDRYVRGRRSALLDGPSARRPQVSVRYRARCCRG